ncbi:MAG: XRE family transcriptional regulator [Oceanospirillum sp.]|nr:XRE family transcriptional regulator [Oceanospirillum sp.]
MQEINRHLADTLKAERKQRGWSLDKAAATTGVSKAMLGQIERGESSPTVATLWKIAGGFRCSLSTFIEAYDDKSPDQSSAQLSSGKPQIRSADQIRHQPAQDLMLVAPLFPFDSQMGFEIFELSLLSGYERESEPHEAGVTEFVLVIEGVMEVLVEGQWHCLEKGMSIRFSADQPHGYRNLSNDTARFHNIIHYPDGTNRS